MIKIQVLKGVRGIKQAYEMSLEAKAIDIICLSEKYMDVIGDWFDRDFQPRLAKSGIVTREILPGIAGNKGTGDSKGKNQVRFLPAGSVNESDMLNFEDTAILVSYDQGDPNAVVIKDQTIVGGFKVNFEAMWNSLS